MKDIKLYPHNQETYDKIQALWETENKVAAVQATGTGKSYLILKCIYNTPEANKVVLAPSNYILEQIEKEAVEQLPNTILLTYSKLSFMSDAEIKSLNIDYIFLDEFHRCGAEQWGDGVQRLLNLFPDAKVLGTSATHIRFLDNARNMGEELFNGNIVNNLSLAEAIVKKILPMPKYISALYTYDNEIDNLKTKVENSKNDEESKKEMLKEIEIMKHKLNKSKGIPNILKKHLSKNYNGKFIIFCKDKVHLDEMKETVVEWFKQSKVTKQVDVYSVYSNYEYGNAEVEAFIENKNPKSVKLLFSIEMFNEGIHIEDVTGVILLRPTVSPIIYYQQIGRAMQTGKSATPVIFDLVNNFDNIGAKNFVGDLEKEVKSENDKVGKDDDKNDGEEKKYVDISEFMIFDETLDARGLFENIEDRLIDNWDAMYIRLKEFCEKNGNSVISQRGELSDLGNWCCRQRDHCKKRKLENDRIEKLNELEFEWNPIETKWDKMYNILIDYKNEFNHIDVKIGEVYKSTPLGNWVSNQRVRFLKNILPQECIYQLDKLGFKWNLFEAKWTEAYNELVNFKNTNNNLVIPRNYKTINGINLYKWMSCQREDYRKNIITQNKKEMLDEIGFIWDVYDDFWNFMFSNLCEYFTETKSNVISRKIIFNEVKLGQWVGSQRKLYKNKQMTEERITKLNSVDFIW